MMHRFTAWSLALVASLAFARAQPPGSTGALARLDALAGRAEVTAVRLGDGPIITPQSSPTLGENINGPSLIRVPGWVQHPLGRYYLYFAHHEGKSIRLAYADRLTGPWTIYEPGTLRLSEAPLCWNHIASPDVHVDDARKEIRMYYHCPSTTRAPARPPEAGHPANDAQGTFLATSTDGLHFSPGSVDLGPFYFRVFRWRGSYYAIARGGTLLRSPDGASVFEQGPDLFGRDQGLVVRHTAVDLRGDTLRVYYSRIGDRPERILLSQVRLAPDWRSWRASPPEDVLGPETDYEGGTLPLEASKTSLALHPVRQLRDPAIFHDQGRTYLIYSVAGESGLAVAELHER